MPKVKYMGTADRYVLKKGEDFDGRLGTPVSKEVVFDKSNKWVVDTDEAGISSDAFDLLLEEGFVDVTDKDRIPSNDHQKMFLGHGATRPASNAEKEAAGDAEDITPTPPKSRRGAASTTTVGGSTPGD